MKNLRNINSANTETKVVFKNVTTNDVVCKKNVNKKIRNGLTSAVLIQIFYLSSDRLVKLQQDHKAFQYNAVHLELIIV